MFFHISTKKSHEPGPLIRMDCPACHTPSTHATTAKVTSREFLYGLVHITTNYYVTITCGNCGKAFRSPMSCDKLGTMSVAEVTELVSTYGMSQVGNITKFCILLSLVFSVLMFIGFLFALIGVIATWNSRSRWRRAAFVGLFLSTLFTIGEVWLSK